MFCRIVWVALYAYSFLLIPFLSSIFGDVLDVSIPGGFFSTFNFF